MANGTVFAFSFSNEGFEAIINLTQIDEEYVLAKMRDDKLPQSVSSLLNMLSIRARANAQRQMEVWLLKFDEDITEDMLMEMAEDDPQSMADLARREGTSVYGAEYHKQKKVIK